MLTQVHQNRVPRALGQLVGPILGQPLLHFRGGQTFVRNLRLQTLAHCSCPPWELSRAPCMQAFARNICTNSSSEVQDRRAAQFIQWSIFWVSRTGEGGRTPSTWKASSAVRVLKSTSCSPLLVSTTAAPGFTSPFLSSGIAFSRSASPPTNPALHCEHRTPGEPNGWADTSPGCQCVVIPVAHLYRHMNQHVHGMWSEMPKRSQPLTDMG